MRKEKERGRRRDAKKKDERENARLCRETAMLGGDAVARAKVGSEGGGGGGEDGQIGGTRPLS